MSLFLIRVLILLGGMFTGFLVATLCVMAYHWNHILDKDTVVHALSVGIFVGLLLAIAFAP